MKTALIIGATSGIGKELAKLLVADNFRVIITGRREKLLNEIKLTAPEKYIIKVHDVTDLISCEKLFENLKNEFKTMDLIVYSSGVGEANYTLDWEKELPILSTNVLAASKIYGLAYNFFRAQGYGHLVGISSIASIRGNRHTPAYFASKAFQANYLESLYMKGKRSKAKIYVTDIQPGFVDTAMALGTTFWMASLEKATKQIYTAIKQKKRKAYITKRWRL
ncbi:SDR family NAD(P)-dependent oxidoreductase, partial [Lutibacter sp.]|uniref:SDR family NAD(P)-dependent oxidoreductase n=1 Tax=Lutibacter sp. TaxID=1925666 RepID=UPI0034A02531